MWAIEPPSSTARADHFSNNRRRTRHLHRKNGAGSFLNDQTCNTIICTAERLHLFMDIAVSGCQSPDL
jgi:hypothetical protein